MVVCTIRGVKMKEYLLLCRELSIFYIGNRVVGDRVV